MLKLEKSAKADEITIVLRQRDRFFNAALVKAFSIALGLHLLAALLFEVQVFKIIGSQTIFPPMMVDADLANGLEGNIFIDINETDLQPLTVKEPHGSPFVFVDPPAKKDSYALNLMENTGTSSTTLFASIEKPDFVPDDVKWGCCRSGSQKIYLHVAGPLAGRPMEWNLTTGANYRVPYLAVYAVQVDDQSGTIFWYEPKHKVVNAALDRIAENILREIRFNTVNGSFVTPGEIEIHFPKDTFG